MSDLCRMDVAVPDLEAAVEAWERLGFDVETAVETGHLIALGSVQLRLLPRNRSPGLVAWCFEGSEEGVVKLDPAIAPPTTTIGERPVPPPAQHPNGVTHVDHVVYMVPALDAAVAGLEGFLGAECRRRTLIRGLPAAFVRCGDSILEIIEVRGSEGPRLWGLALAVGDIDKSIAAIRECGGEVSDAGPAVQGGRIASSPPEACFGLSLAYMQRDS